MGHVILLDQDYASVVDFPHFAEIFARNHIQKHHMDMVEWLKSWLINNFLLNWLLTGLTGFLCGFFFSLKVPGKTLSLKMPLNKNKLFLLLGMLCLEQGKPAILPLPRGKFQMNSVTTFIRRNNLCWQRASLLYSMCLWENRSRYILGICFSCNYFGLVSCNWHMKLHKTFMEWTTCTNGIDLEKTGVIHSLGHITQSFCMSKFWKSTCIWKHL